MNKARQPKLLDIASVVLFGTCSPRGGSWWPEHGLAVLCCSPVQLRYTGIPVKPEIMASAHGENEMTLEISGKSGPRRCVPSRRIGPLVGFLAWMTLTGCSSGPVEIKGKPGGANLAKIGIAYARASEHLGRPPQKLEELKSFLKKEYGEADSLLRSAEDGQPFQIIWGVDIFQAQAGSTARLWLLTRGRE